MEIEDLINESYELRCSFLSIINPIFYNYKSKKFLENLYSIYDIFITKLANENPDFDFSDYLESIPRVKKISFKNKYEGLSQLIRLIYIMIANIHNCYLSVKGTLENDVDKFFSGFDISDEEGDYFEIKNKILEVAPYDIDIVNYSEINNIDDIDHIIKLKYYDFYLLSETQASDLKVYSQYPVFVFLSIRNKVDELFKEPIYDLILQILSI